MVSPVVSLNREINNWMNKEAQLLSPPLDVAHESRCELWQWLFAQTLPCPGVRGLLLCSHVTAITQGCSSSITQASLFCTNSEVQSCPDNAHYRALFRHSPSNTLCWTQPSWVYHFFYSDKSSNHFTDKSSFLGPGSQEVAQCSSAGCAATDRHVPTGLDLQKGLKENRSLFLLSSRAQSDLVNNKIWALSVNGCTLPFMSAVPQIYYKAQCQLSFASLH